MDAALDANRPFSHRYRIAIFTILFVLRVEGSDNPPPGEAITITAVPEYINARPCLQACLNGDGSCNRNSAPPAALQCSRNSCLCRPDLQTVAVGLIAQCASDPAWCACGNTVDASSGVAIYNAYCKAYSQYPTGSPSLVLTTSTLVNTPTTIAPVTSVIVKTVAATESPTTYLITQTATVRSGSSSILASVNLSSIELSVSTIPNTPSVILAPTDSIMSSPTSTASPPQMSLSQSDRIALGVGLSMGLVATITGFIGLVFMWRQQKGIFYYRRGSE